MDQAAHALRLLMMHDKQGKYLLIVPADLELQPDLLEAATGRKLVAIAPAALQRYFRQPGMRRAAGQAKLFASLPSYADTRVIAEDAVLIEATTGMLIDIDLTQTYLEQIPKANLGKTLAADADMPRVPNQQVESVIYQHTQKRIGDRIEETFAIPTLSPTTQKLLDLRSNPDAGVEQLVPIVSSDPSLSAQVVAWANSPMFAAPGRAKSIEDAVVRILGYDLVLNLSISMLLGSELKFDLKGPRGAVPFWMRALATARLTEMLARQMPVTRRPAIGLVYLTGLLHNFGTLLLAHLFSPQYTKLCRTIELNPHIEQWRLEQSLLGVDSAQLAAWLFEHWSLPHALVDAVRWQFQPEAAPNKSPLAMLICLSSRLLREQGLSDGPVEALPEGMSELLGLRYPQIEEAVSQFETIREDLEETVSQLNN